MSDTTAPPRVGPPRDREPPTRRAPTRAAGPRISPERLALGAVALLPLAIYLWVALHRIGYPFELDWMEGGSVQLAARVSAGHSLYVAPTLAYVGWTYTPLYYLASAAVGAFTGVGFVALRLVSLLASVAAMAALYGIVRGETGERSAGLLAAGLFAATFRLSGAWMDTGRVDSLFVALTLAAIAAGSRVRGVRGGLGLGVLAFAAFFTKQSALFALGPALVVLALRRPRAGLPALGTLVALVGGSTLLLDALTGGWYRYYVVDELAHQAWSHAAWVGFWRHDLLEHLWPVLLGALVALFLGRRSRAETWLYYGAAAAGLLGCAWVSRLHSGGYANVLMPAYAALALVVGLAYGWLPRTSVRARWAALPIVLVQLALLAYPISAQIPTAADRAAGAALLARLRSLPGPVLLLRHPWYATETGRGSFAQEEAIGDVLRSSDPRGARSLRASLRDGLDADHIQAVILDGSFDRAVLEPGLSRDFRLVPGSLTPQALYPLTDVRTAPRLLYLRVR